MEKKKLLDIAKKMNPMYVAVELSENGSINDHGTISETPISAWKQVSDMFSAEDTVVVEVIPFGTVNVVPTKHSISKFKK